MGNNIKEVGSFDPCLCCNLGCDANGCEIVNGLEMDNALNSAIKNLTYNNLRCIEAGLELGVLDDYNWSIDK